MEECKECEVEWKNAKNVKLNGRMQRMVMAQGGYEYRPYMQYVQMYVQ